MSLDEEVRRSELRDKRDPRKTDPIIPEHKGPPEPEGPFDNLEERVEHATGIKERDPLPPFLREQVRHREAYLSLIRDLAYVLADDWQTIPPDRVKANINGAIADSLSMWI